MSTHNIGHYINGQHAAGSSGRFSDVYNPATGEVSGKLCNATAIETIGAIDAAQAAFPAWSATPALRRARILFKFKTLLDEHANDLAKAISLEHGKTISDARGEVTRGIEVVEFAVACHICSKVTITNKSVRVSTHSVCTSRSVWWQVLHLSTFRSWCRYG